MLEQCPTCSGLDSLRCLDCHDRSKYRPLVELRSAIESRKPHSSPTAEVVPITNEMHLRFMSREELADVLYGLYLHSADFDCGEISLLWCDGEDSCYDEDGEILCNEERHKACILRWLDAPYVPKEEST